MPLPALLIIGFIGLLVLWLSNRKWLASLFLVFSLVGIGLISFQPFSSSLLMPLEREYKGFLPPDNGPVDFVMVLGNSHVVDDEIPSTSELSRAALMRLAEGIRIHRLYPNSKMILSGYDGGYEVSHARMLARVAMALGVNKNQILLLETAKDTAEEAYQASTVVGNSRLVLVTSASHMPRALDEFHLMGLEPIPAPTNFLAQKEIKQPWIKYTPKAQYMEQFERYWHETLGRVWLKWRDTVLNIFATEKKAPEPVQVTEPTEADESPSPEQVPAPLTAPASGAQ